MAFKKTTQLNNGFSAEYWRINSIEANKDAPFIEIYVSGYKDKATRQSGSKPVTSKKFQLKTSDFDFSSDLFEQAYNLIKTEKEFKDTMNPEAVPFFADAIND